MSTESHDSRSAFGLSLWLSATLTLPLVACGEDGASDPSPTLMVPRRGDASQAGVEAPEGAGGVAPEQTPPDRSRAGSSSNSPGSAGPCLAPTSFESVPARSVVMSRRDPPSQRLVYTPDLFEAFDNLCGTCHVVQGLGDFRIRDLFHLAEDTAKFQTSIIATMRSDDKSDVMPPYEQTKTLGSERKPGDPVVELIGLFEAFFAAGSPRDLFYVPVAPRTGAPVGSYTFSRDVAMQLTNIGSCLPSTHSMAIDKSTMERLDGFFEQASELPRFLDETDLTSFDSAALAQSGVVSFAPAYPLFSDGARKLRHVRVPRGRSIVFDRARQQFDIPDNTRFYKTFLKQVIERDGAERYRKLETRLIVARRDPKDGAHEANALFGTYAWDENETSAELVTDPLRNGEPFRDRLVTYVVDEGKAEMALANSQAEDRRVALLDTGATRTWAIPGSERCIQCHMGSDARNFVLGFVPLQINRRRSGEGGSYESTSADELAQLQRLMDLGVITGITSSDDILPLEKSQGERSPRTEHELVAQGYMLGNCANCHNPRGYPSVENPAIAELLDLYPSRRGGIFQFPLERVSPRIKRGVDQDIDIPYITPSLVDKDQEVNPYPVPIENPGSNWQNRDLAVGTVVQKDKEPNTTYYMAAPWRSLIYRNVDTPFLYAEDHTLYPHMPMNVAGFDARAPRIMGDWMVSIPAKLKPEAGADRAKFERTMSGQPYVEVKPGDADYSAAQAEARQRLELYRGGGVAPLDYFPEQSAGERHATFFDNVRYAKYSPDVRDTVTGDAEDHCGLPSECERLRKMNGQPEDDREHYWGLSGDMVPDRPNWIRMDFSDPPGDWYPRRSDWQDVLVAPGMDQVTVFHERYPNPQLCKARHPDPPEDETCIQLCPLGEMPPSASARPCRTQDSDAEVARKFVVGELRYKTLTHEFIEFALAPRPFGPWKPRSDCSYPGVRRVSDFGAEDAWRWMTNAPEAAQPRPDTPVYMDSIGAQVYKQICINCHGRELDSRGRQAAKLFEKTGKSRVANFRDGLLGPRDDPGAYRALVFAKRANKALDAEDWAARYTAWMGLGGTNSAIDLTILGLVANTPVLGEKRKTAVRVQDANMLAVALTMCRETLGQLAFTSLEEVSVHDGGLVDRNHQTSALEAVGDGEMWRRLCGFQNPRPISVLDVPSENGGTGILRRHSLRNARDFPADGQLADHHGVVHDTGYSAGNQFPWCLRPATDDAERKRVADLAASLPGRRLPECPSSWLASAKPMTPEERARWAVRGAINAGFAVFAYIDRVSKDARSGRPEPPNFDECELLEAQP